MFSKDSRVNVLLTIMFLALSACGGIGSGCGCSQQPLPPGGLPDDQTVEGGGQIRVTRAGFEKLTSVVPAILNDSLGGGFCVDRQSILGADVCYTNQGGCNPGCRVNVSVQETRLQVTNAQTLNVYVRANANASVRIDPPIFSACTMTITANNLSADLDIGFSIDPATGELRLRLNRINDYNLSGVNYSGCSVISFLASLVTDLLDSFLGEFIVDLLTPTINDLIQGFLPDPLGIEGMVDVGQLLAGVSPGTEGFMEARMVPGGYVQLGGGGMSLGLITGLNADQDPTTRTAALDSEPAYCVPPIPAPNFAAPPASLPVSTRGTFTLMPAGAFVGSPEPADDLAIGMSETTLDLAGHHLVTSGGLCLGVGTSLVEQLKLGTIGLLVPSIGELGTGDEPLLLVTRPQKAIDFSIGDGTEASPALTLHIKGFEVDFYGFIYERYTRAFTMSLDLDVGVNLEFTQMPGMPAQVIPTLVGLSSSNIGITVLNNEFVRETRSQLEAVLPTVFDLALPLLANGIGPIDVPDFAGFTLNNLRVQKVTTAQDDFMAIYASLGASMMMRDRATQYPSLEGVIDTLDQHAEMGNWPELVAMGPGGAQARHPGHGRQCSTGGSVVRVLGDVVDHLLGRVGRAVGLLRRVLELHLREVQRHVLGQAVLAAGAAAADRRDQHLFHLDLDVLDRGALAAGLAHDQVGLRVVLAVAAGQQQRVRRRVGVLREGQVLHVGLAGAAAAALVRGAGVADAPAPGQHVDLVRMLLVGRLALDVADLHEHVYGHGVLSLVPRGCWGGCCCNVARWTGRPPAQPQAGDWVKSQRVYPAFAEGSLETSLRDTVRPSSW